MDPMGDNHQRNTAFHHGRSSMRSQDRRQFIEDRLSEAGSKSGIRALESGASQTLMVRSFSGSMNAHLEPLRAAELYRVSPEISVDDLRQ